MVRWTRYVCHGCGRAHRVAIPDHVTNFAVWCSPCRLYMTPDYLVPQ